MVASKTAGGGIWYPWYLVFGIRGIWYLVFGVWYGPVVGQSGVVKNAPQTVPYEPLPNLH